MTPIKRLIVVDDNWRFAVHVWRHLTGSMEFGLPPGPPASFERVSPDGFLEVVWHNPRERAAFDTFRGRCRAEGCEIWCAIDVRGVPGPNGEPNGWETYHQVFTSIAGKEHASRAWIMSSYGHRGWGSDLAVRPKTIETLRALAKVLRPPAPLATAAVRTPETSADVHVLVTGAGFELKARGQTGESIGCPPTDQLLRGMRPGGREYPTRTIEGKVLYFPVPNDATDLVNAAERGLLDEYWDALLYSFTQTRPTEAAMLELQWREAFRRAFLAHDFGHLVQSLTAARLDWDYWLTTNYTRFSDRAIDMVGDTPQRRHWRAITTSIEADAVAPFAGSSEDLAKNERVIVKLHGDIGHVWTMAVAGQDKRPDSKLSVRPELHRMYALAESMLLGSLGVRRSERQRCFWHVIGHGMQDKSLTRLIATVIQRSMHWTEHNLIYVGPKGAGIQDQKAAFGALRTRFADVGAARLCDVLCEYRPGTDAANGTVTIQYAPLTALEYLSRIAPHPLAKAQDVIAPALEEPPPRASDSRAVQRGTDTASTPRASSRQSLPPRRKAPSKRQ